MIAAWTAITHLRHPDGMYQAATVLTSIAAIWLAATLVPGPDFLATTRVALTNDRAVGMRTVLGIACGTCVWGLAGFFGVHALFTATPWLYLALKLGGGAYLVFLGIRLIVGSFGGRASEAAHLRPLSAGSAFRLGLITNLANPKAALFTASLFAATLPPHPPIALGLGAAVIMTTIALAWYGTVACVLTTRRAATVFTRLRHWIDRLAGLAFIGFGARLTLER